MSEKQSKNFFVLEQEDCENYLTATEQNILWELQKKVYANRYINGKNMREKYYVINQNDKYIQEIKKLLPELMEEIAKLE